KPVAAAGKAGEQDPVGLWAAGARAILEDTWRRRDVAKLFLASEKPPDFDTVQGGRHAQLTERSRRVLELPDTDQGRLYANCLQSMSRAGARSTVQTPGRAESKLVIEATISYCLRLMVSGPATPDTAVPDTAPSRTAAPPPPPLRTPLRRPAPGKAGGWSRRQPVSCCRPRRPAPRSAPGR